MFFLGRDGVQLVYEEIGEGRPVVLFHGRMDRGSEFIESGVAGRLTQLDYRVILPDMRGHGASAKPHDAAAWPIDVLTDDGLALLDHLRLEEYDLIGHSLGGRTVARMLTRGATPRRAVISGQGLDALTTATQRNGWSRDFFTACGTGAFAPGSDEQETEDWIHSNGADPKALLLSLDSYVNTSIAELGRVTVPTLVLTGKDDAQDRSARALALALAAGRYVQVPGDHFTAKASPEFAEALIDFLRR